MTTKVSGKSEESITQDKTVKAGTNVVIQAGAKTEVKSSAELKLNSTKIESSAAVLNEIKGALVKIN